MCHVSLCGASQPMKGARSPFWGRKVLKESGVRISYSSALTHRKRGLDSAMGGLFALSIDSVRGWFGRCLNPFGTSRAPVFERAASAKRPEAPEDDPLPCSRAFERKGQGGKRWGGRVDFVWSTAWKRAGAQRQGQPPVKDCERNCSLGQKGRDSVRSAICD